MQNSESSSQIETLYKLVGGKAEALEFRVSEASNAVCGVPLQEAEAAGKSADRLHRPRRTDPHPQRPGHHRAGRQRDRRDVQRRARRELEDILAGTEGRAMNKRVIVYVLGAVLLIEAALMLLPLLVAVIYREKNGWYFLWVLLGAAVLGALALGLGGRKRSAMYAKEGLIAVALSWIVLSLVGALPFTLSGQIPFYLDAVFEMISGFTTTGSSILPAVEPLDRCMLFWRSLSHWIGGMGILVFMLAIVRMDGGQAIHLLRAESPGPTVSKMVPRMVDSSKILYGIYFGLTVVQILLYLAGGDTAVRFALQCVRYGGHGRFCHQDTTLSPPTARIRRRSRRSSWRCSA